MTDTPTKSSFGAQPWRDGPLYIFLCDMFPDYRSTYRFLDVVRLASDMRRSTEAVYKRLRNSRLTPANADALRALAAARNPAIAPERKDFDPFVYA